MAFLGLILLLFPALESSYLIQCLPLGFATLLLWHSWEEMVSFFIKGQLPFSNGTAARSTQERRGSLLKAAVVLEGQEACCHGITPKGQQLIWKAAQLQPQERRPDR